METVVANLFVVSRMKNVAERKAVIDVIHQLGHSPGFIEAQQMGLGVESLRLMNKMADTADGLVIIVDEDYDLGQKDKNCGHRPPMVYEILRFMERMPDWREDGRILAFYRRSPSRPRVSQAAADLMGYLECDQDFLTPFYNYDDLTLSSHDAILDRWGVGEPEHTEELHIHISWSGQDRPGLLGEMAGFLFTEFGLNVTHLSGIGVDGHGSIMLTGETHVHPLPTPEAIREALADPDGLGLRTSVDQIGLDGFPSELYFELRVLDVPGVLNALCKVLGESNVSIDDIRQRPASREYDRQAVIMVWLSTPHDDSDLDVNRTFMRLESRLRNLVGVRSLGSRRLRSSSR